MTALRACWPRFRARRASRSPPPAPWFRGIGDLPGGDHRSEVLALSQDGRVLLGRSPATDLEEEGFLLRLEGFELVPLTGPDGRASNSQPAGITDDLRTSSARWTRRAGLSRRGAGRKRRLGGPAGLAGGDDMSQALDVSGDGRVVVGWAPRISGLVAVRWVDGEALELGDLPGGPSTRPPRSSRATAGLVAGTGASDRGLEVFALAGEAPASSRSATSRAASSRASLSR